MRRAVLLLGLAVVAVPRRAGAVSPPDDETKALPCRPTIACTADIVSPGLFELETGALFRNLNGARQWTYPFLTKLTLARFVQLQIGSNGYTTQHGEAAADPSARYFDDVVAGAKLHLVDQAALVPSLSLSGAVSTPVSPAQEGYARTEDLFFIAYVTKDFGPLHADLNLGLNDWAIDATPAIQEWVALALSAALSPVVGAMVENYYYADAAPLAARDGGCLFALSLSPRPWLVFDFGGDIGYFPGTRSYSSFVGMTIVPVKLWL